MGRKCPCSPLRKASTITLAIGLQKLSRKTQRHNWQVQQMEGKVSHSQGMYLHRKNGWISKMAISRVVTQKLTVCIKQKRPETNHFLRVVTATATVFTQMSPTAHLSSSLNRTKTKSTWSKPISLATGNCLSKTNNKTHRVNHLVVRSLWNIRKR